MSYRDKTRYRDDALEVQNGTQPEEIHDFVIQRAAEPYEIGENLIWNFNNHVLDKEALEEQHENLLNNEFVVPFQASGVWGYMVSLLPEIIRDAEILTYNRSRNQYNPYPNFYRHVPEDQNEEVRQEVLRKIQEHGL